MSAKSRGDRGDGRDPPGAAGAYLQRHPDAGVDLLIGAGVVLATSLRDQATTMREVAALTVPSLGDLCVIDLVDKDGSINDVAVAASDPELERGLEDLRGRFPLSQAGPHPVARAIRTGRPSLLSHMDTDKLRSFAASSKHAHFMIEHGYRSAVVAPLVARDRTLGAISVLRLGDRAPYRREDLDLVQALAWRAALAIDNARLFDEVRGLEERMEAILVNLAEAITVVDGDERTIFANQAAADLLGVSTPEEVMSASGAELMTRFLVLDEQGRELDLEAMPSRRIFRGELPGPLIVRNIVRATGEERWLIVRCSPIFDPASSKIMYAVNVFENVSDIKRAQLAGDFLAEASRLLVASSSSDYDLTLAPVARLAVTRIADWCAVDLLGERGEIRRVALEHGDPQKLKIADRLAREYTARRDDRSGVAEVIRSGKSRLYSGIDDELLSGYARDHTHLQPPRDMQPATAITVPMAAAGKVIGAITVASTESRRRLGKDELELMEELGRRAGVAVENARLNAERTRIARTLQQALLPESLPLIAGIEIEALYTAAGELNEVGGDFYDVFQYDNDSWTLAIGDVCGKGPQAASVTALARYTLRAAAMSGHGPVDMLNMLHQTLLHHSSSENLCTVCLVTLSPVRDGARLTIALAGHPPPLLIKVGKQVTQVGTTGTLLGVIDPLTINPIEMLLKKGETLLLYTDGIIDAGADGQVIGEDGLLELCSEAETASLRTLLTRIENAAFERSQGMLRDDVALLAVRPAR